VTLAITDAGVEPAAASQVPTTTVTRPTEDADRLVPTPRSLTQVRLSDVLALVGAAVASLALTSLLFTRLLPWSGALGMVVVFYAIFLGVYAVLCSFSEDGATVRARVVSVVIHTIATVLLGALVCIVVFTVVRGIEPMRHLNFYVQDMVKAGPLAPLSDGGVLHALVGTLEQISIALLITVPLGLTTAVFLAMTRGSFARFTRTVVEAMTALPSIVAGLFIYATVIIMMGQGKSGGAASLALGVMMLPIIIRSADVVLRLVPGTLVEASYALGASTWRTVWTVVLPTARSGLATAVILGTARGIGETSPVLLTAGFTKYMNTNPFGGPQVSLPLATFDFIKSPQPTEVARGFGTAALLLILVLLLFVIARTIGGRGPGRPTRRQTRAADRRSKRDIGRMSSRTNPAVTSPASSSAASPRSSS
jgi:phosphate transport system permease protein